MKMPKRITVEMLKKMGACKMGIRQFRRVFGKSCAITPKNVKAADNAKMQILWMLEALRPAVALGIRKKCLVSRTGGGACTCEAAAAKVFLRFARRNAPAKKARAAR